MNLLWLGDPKTFDAALVSGQTANLSRLASLGDRRQRVPDGFCLLVTLMDAAHPFDLRNEITAAVADLMRCHCLPGLVAAVRSSAVEDDGANASVAGQHEIYLNIIGAEVIVEAAGPGRKRRDYWCWFLL